MGYLATYDITFCRTIEVSLAKPDPIFAQGRYRFRPCAKIGSGYARLDRSIMSNSSVTVTNYFLLRVTV